MDVGRSRSQKKKLSMNLLQMKSDVRVEIQEDLSNNPKCPHGPTVLFKCNNKRFYACSAFRNTKECPFRNLEDEKIAEGESSVKKLNVEDGASSCVKTAWSSKRLPKFYCKTCQELSSDEKHHSGHDCIRPITEAILNYPSRFLEPIQKDNAEAQYHFSQDSGKFLLDSILSYKSTAFLCIGAPTIYERLRILKKSALLMDIDYRYRAFYPMLRYNMFNHHFFSAEDRKIYDRFLVDNAKSSLTIITDPPFGGKIELLGLTFERIRKDWHRPDSYLRIFWIFPYFMESAISRFSEMSNLRMMDYPIEYENHAKYSRRKQGSPIRLFTNVSLNEIKLCKSRDKKYKKCLICQVVTMGYHCQFCKKCPSKNGGEYHHCSMCARCVKSSWVHCSSCNRCALPDHPCDLFKQKKRLKQL